MPATDAVNEPLRITDALLYVARKSVQARAGRPVVLLVDDELHIRRLGVVVLEEAGYAVIEAKGSADALDGLETGRAVDLLSPTSRFPAASTDCSWRTWSANAGPRFGC